MILQLENRKSNEVEFFHGVGVDLRRGLQHSILLYSIIEGGV